MRRSPCDSPVPREYTHSVLAVFFPHAQASATAPWMGDPRPPRQNEGHAAVSCLCQWVVANALLVWNDYAIAKEEHERAYVSEQVGQALRGY